MKPDFFLNMARVNTLTTLLDQDKTWYPSLIAKDTGSTYVYTVKVLDELAEKGLVVFNREGRVKLVSLTESGEEIAHTFKELLRKVEKIGGTTNEGKEGKEEN